MFINDLPSCITLSKIILYADDTAVFYAHKDVKAIELVLQKDLQALSSWFSDNGLIFNCSKTNVILFGTSQCLSRSVRPTLSSSGTLLQVKDSVKHLGLILDARMNWHEHIDLVALKASRRLSFLGRIRKYINTDVCRQLHGSIIRPLYEYCDVIWTNTDKTSLENS